VILKETAGEMTEEEESAFIRKMQVFRYSLTDKERSRLDAILEQSAISSVRDSGFDESVWLAAYAD
jgi:hypothetical protein